MMAGTVTQSRARTKPAETLRISEAARLAGVSSRTLRYYEEIRLIAPSGHTPGGERRYSRESIEELQRIRELKELFGFNLDEIRELLDTERQLGSLREKYRATGTEADVASLSTTARKRRKKILNEALALNTRLTDTVDRKLDSIRAFRKELGTKATRYRQLLAELDGAEGS